MKYIRRSKIKKKHKRLAANLIGTYKRKNRSTSFNKWLRNKFNAVYFFLRSLQLLSWPRNSTPFIRTKYLLSFSQDPVNISHPEPVESSLLPHTTLSILILFFHLHLGLSSCLFPLCFPTKIYGICHLSHVPHTFHPLWFDCRNNICRNIQISSLCNVKTT